MNPLSLRILFNCRSKLLTMVLCTNGLTAERPRSGHSSSTADEHDREPRRERSLPPSACVNVITVPRGVVRMTFKVLPASIAASSLLVAACDSADRSPGDAAALSPGQVSAPLDDSGALRAPAGIGWIDGDIDAAFSAARSNGKPILLYWGAEWCP